MDPVAIVLAGTIAIMTIALVLAFWWTKSAMDARSASDARANAIDGLRASAERSRDLALADAAKNAGDLALVGAQLSATTKSLADARAEVEKHVRESLVTGSDADVAAEVDRLLGNVPAVRGPDAAGANRGVAGPAAVPGPGPAATDPARRAAGG